MATDYRDYHPDQICAVCGGILEWDEWNAQGYIHRNDSDDTHAPEVSE